MKAAAFPAGDGCQGGMILEQVDGIAVVYVEGGGLNRIRNQPERAVMLPAYIERGPRLLPAAPQWPLGFEA